MSTIKTNSTPVLIFPLIASSDHVSPVLGANPTATISKAGGAFAAPAGVVTEIGNGWYKLTATAADTNTVGALILHATAANADPADAVHEVVAYDPAAATNLGLSALPTANPGAANGLPVVTSIGAVVSSSLLRRDITDVAPRKVGDAITKIFSVVNPTDGTRYGGASFTVTALDPTGVSIAAQITPAQFGVTGVYSYSFTPTKEGVYYVGIFETNTKQYIDTEFIVGGTVVDRVLNLANAGQNVNLGAGTGGFVYPGTITLSGAPQAGVVVKAYQAQDTNGTDTNAVVDLQTVIAQATTAADGTFSLSLNASYYALLYTVGGALSQTYIRWSTGQAKWVTSSSPISTSQL